MDDQYRYLGGQVAYTPSMPAVYTPAGYTAGYAQTDYSPYNQGYGVLGEETPNAEEKKECKCDKKLLVNGNNVVGTATVGALTATNWQYYPFWAERRGDNASMWSLVKLSNATANTVTLTYDDLKTRADGKIGTDGVATFAFGTGGVLTGDQRGTFNAGTQQLTIADHTYLPLVQDARCDLSAECKSSTACQGWTVPYKNYSFWTILVVVLIVFFLIGLGVGRSTVSCKS